MSLTDILKLHDAIDAIADAEYRYHKQQEKNQK